MYRLALTLTLLVTLGLVVGRAQEDRSSPSESAPSAVIVSADAIQGVSTERVVAIPGHAAVPVAVNSDSRSEAEPPAARIADESDEDVAADPDNKGDNDNEENNEENDERGFDTEESEVLWVQSEPREGEETLLWQHDESEIDIRVVDLRYMQAEAAAKMITQLFPDADLIVQAEARRNQLVVRTNPVLQEKIAELIRKIDQPAPQGPQSAVPVQQPEDSGRKKVMVLEDRTIVSEDADPQGGVDRRVEIRRMVPAAGVAGPSTPVPGGNVTGPGGPVVWYRHSSPDIQPLRFLADQGQHELAILADQIRQLRAATEPDKDALADLEAQLKGRVREVFDARQQLQRAELAVLQQQLISIEQTIAARDRMKDQLVDKRVEQILSDKPPADVLRWREGPPKDGDVDVLIPLPHGTNLELEGHGPARPPLVLPPRPPRPPAPSQSSANDPTETPVKPYPTSERQDELQLVTKLQRELMERVKAVEESMRQLAQQPGSFQSARQRAALKDQLAATEAELKELAEHQTRDLLRGDQARQKELRMLERELERAKRQLEEVIERSNSRY